MNKPVSTRYIKLEQLVDFAIYHLDARKSNIGIWSDYHQAFLISKYEGSVKPEVFFETHWDTVNELGYWGTAKPLKQLAICPDKYRAIVSSDAWRSNSAIATVLDYLDNLEAELTSDYNLNLLQQRQKQDFGWRDYQIKQRNSVIGNSSVPNAVV